jgi:hypothetical protein
LCDELGRYTMYVLTLNTFVAQVSGSVWFFKKNIKLYRFMPTYVSIVTKLPIMWFNHFMSQHFSHKSNRIYWLPLYIECTCVILLTKHELGQILAVFSYTHLVTLALYVYIRSQTMAQNRVTEMHLKNEKIHFKGILQWNMVYIHIIITLSQHYISFLKLYVAWEHNHYISRSQTCHIADDVVMLICCFTCPGSFSKHCTQRLC